MERWGAERMCRGGRATHVSRRTLPPRCKARVRGLPARSCYWRLRIEAHHEWDRKADSRGLARFEWSVPYPSAPAYSIHGTDTEWEADGLRPQSPFEREEAEFVQTEYAMVFVTDPDMKPFEDLYPHGGDVDGDGVFNTCDACPEDPLHDDEGTCAP